MTPATGVSHLVCSSNPALTISVGAIFENQMAEEKTACQDNCTNNELILNVKAKRAPRFKAGATLSKKVNLVDVDLIEHFEEDFESTEIKMKFKIESCYCNDEKPPQ